MACPAAASPTGMLGPAQAQFSDHDPCPYLRYSGPVAVRGCVDALIRGSIPRMDSRLARESGSHFDGLVAWFARLAGEDYVFHVGRVPARKRSRPNRW